MPHLPIWCSFPLACQRIHKLFLWMGRNVNEVPRLTLCWSNRANWSPADDLANFWWSDQPMWLRCCLQYLFVQSFWGHTKIVKALLSTHREAGVPAMWMEYHGLKTVSPTSSAICSAFGGVLTVLSTFLTPNWGRRSVLIGFLSSFKSSVTSVSSCLLEHEIGYTFKSWYYSSNYSVVIFEDSVNLQLG